MPQRSSWRSIGIGLAAASSIIAGVLAGGCLGWVVDYYLFPKQPWGLLVGLLLGLVLGSRQALLIINKI